NQQGAVLCEPKGEAAAHSGSLVSVDAGSTYSSLAIPGFGLTNSGKLRYTNGNVNSARPTFSAVASGFVFFDGVTAIDGAGAYHNVSDLRLGNSSGTKLPVPFQAQVPNYPNLFYDVNGGIHAFDGP